MASVGPIAIEEDTKNNTAYRNVIATATRMQIVLMSLKPGEEIGWESHKADQFIRLEQGQLQVSIIINDRGTPTQLNYNLIDGDAFIIPEGTHHNVVNSGKNAAKLYTIYSPPQHEPNKIEDEKKE